jgi:hypothetical protein
VIAVKIAKVPIGSIVVHKIKASRINFSVMSSSLFNAQRGIIFQTIAQRSHEVQDWLLLI